MTGNLSHGLDTYHFQILSRYSELKHGVFGRKGGLSRPPFDSLNLSFDVGDEALSVAENRKKVKVCLGVPLMASSRQVHGTEIAVVDNLNQDRELQGFDALITRDCNVALLIKQADCQAVLLYDPRKKVIANIHSGWRGNAANIIGRTVKLMRNNFDCFPDDIVAAIGPSLGPCCAEFKNFRKEFPIHFWQFETDASHFDLWEISRSQLLESGIRRENIEIAGTCTKCHTDSFFSYRGEKETGRFGTAIALSGDSK